MITRSSSRSRRTTSSRSAAVGGQLRVNLQWSAGVPQRKGLFGRSSGGAIDLDLACLGHRPRRICGPGDLMVLLADWMEAWVVCLAHLAPRSWPVR